MPKNKGKGGKNRRRGKNENDMVKRELEIAEEGQCYAQATRMLGNGRLEAICFNDDKKRLCHIRGKMRKKVWVSVGDIILIGLREFQDDKADVIHKFYPEEARELKKRGELPASVKINETGAAAGGSEMATGEAVEGAFEFDENSEEDEEENVDIDNI